MFLIIKLKEKLVKFDFSHVIRETKKHAAFLNNQKKLLNDLESGFSLLSSQYENLRKTAQATKEASEITEETIKRLTALSRAFQNLEGNVKNFLGENKTQKEK